MKDWDRDRENWGKRNRKCRKGGKGREKIMKDCKGSGERGQQQRKGQRRKLKQLREELNSGLTGVKCSVTLALRN